MRDEFVDANNYQPSTQQCCSSLRLYIGRFGCCHCRVACAKYKYLLRQPGSSTLGNIVKLSSFRGQYVLVDFWASWCMPCRAENPNVVKAYQQYHDKGFTVLSVSLDQPGKKEAWLNAIHQDHLTWTQVSDLRFWNNAVAKMYGIQSIPQNFLLDKDGKIVASNIRGEELGKKLSEILHN